jgi:DNA-binding NarL/FixJ family response regulator
VHANALTPTEQQIADLAADRSNPEIARAVSVSLSPRTVESNLTKIYRKLKVRSRGTGGEGCSPAPRRCTVASTRPGRFRVATARSILAADSSAPRPRTSTAARCLSRRQVSGAR